LYTGTTVITQFIGIDILLIDICLLTQFTYLWQFQIWTYFQQFANSLRAISAAMAVQPGHEFTIL
jgi:hypothetical protein